MNIFYWSPFISKVATVNSVIRSAESIIKYAKKDTSVSLIDSIGEWQDYKEEINSKIEIIKLNHNYYKFLPKGGFIKSRISYLIIFFLNFNKLKKLINDKKPNYLIIHLLTSLPIFLTLFFNNNTKIILRLSGLPKLNIFRYFFWKLFSKKIYRITCPTIGTYNSILKQKIFDKDKLCILRDPAIFLKEYAKKKFENIHNFSNKDKKIIIGIGRFTKQKNFLLLIKAFREIIHKYPEYELILLGDGEEEVNIKRLITKYKLDRKVHLLGFKKNVYKYLKKADCFILTSLWEDPGFVLLEAGLSNTTVISSNCKNGPEEILNNGENGYLFESNNLNDLLKKFDEFRNESEKKLTRKKIKLKKQLKKFTFYSHYNELRKIINLEN